jgi:hypothetical protein
VNSRIAWQSAFGHGSLIEGRQSGECKLSDLRANSRGLSGRTLVAGQGPFTSFRRMIFSFTNWSIQKISTLSKDLGQQHELWKN